jgi:hypothetical protein
MREQPPKPPPPSRRERPCYRDTEALLACTREQQPAPADAHEHPPPGEKLPLAPPPEPELMTPDEVTIVENPARPVVAVTTLALRVIRSR